MTQAIQTTKSLKPAWMTGWCTALGLFGLIIAGGGFEATSGPIQMFFDVLNGPGELDLNPHTRFILAVLGAVTIGWSLTLMVAIQATHQIEQQARRSIWLGIVASIVVWYVIDSSLSIATGFWLNAVSNTIICATFLILVIRYGALRS
jgi:signal transduction histidine kinase